MLPRDRRGGRSLFSYLEKIGRDVEDLKKDPVSDQTPAITRTIHGVGRDIIFLRHPIGPVSEVTDGLRSAELLLDQYSAGVRLRDVHVHDRTIHSIDAIKSLCDMFAGVADIRLSSINSRMNESMKALTVIAAIFMLPAFMTGFWRMNFRHMPELG